MNIGTDDQLLFKYPQLSIEEINGIRSFFESEEFYQSLLELNDLDKESDKGILDIILNTSSNNNTKNKFIGMFISYMLGFKFNYNNNDSNIDLEDLYNLGLLYKYKFLKNVSDNISFSLNNTDISGCNIKTSIIEIHDKNGFSEKEYEKINNHFYIFKLDFLDSNLNISTPVRIFSRIVSNYAIAGLITLVGIPLLIIFSTIYLGNFSLYLGLGIYIGISIIFNIFYYHTVIKKSNLTGNKYIDNNFLIYSKDTYQIEKLFNSSFKVSFSNFIKTIPSFRKTSFIYHKKSLYIKYDFLHTRDNLFNITSSNLVDDLILTYIEIKGINKLLQK